MKRLIKWIMALFSRRSRRDKTAARREQDEARSEQASEKTVTPKSEKIEQPKPEIKPHMPKHVRLGINKTAVTPFGLRIKQLTGSSLPYLSQVYGVNLVTFKDTGILDRRRSS